MSADCQAGFNADCPDCVSHDSTCGIRCGTCDERMCAWFGPEPATVTCGAHDNECADCNGENPCRDCASIRRMTAAAAAAWDAAAEPGPYIDPARDASIDQAAELRAEERAYELAQLEDREEGDRYGAA